MALEITEHCSFYSDSCSAYLTAARRATSSDPVDIVICDVKTGWVQTRQNDSGCGIGRSQQTVRVNINMVHIYFVQKLESKLL